MHKPALVAALVYAAVIASSLAILLHEPTTPPATNTTVERQQMVRGAEVEKRAWKAMLLALPWILVFSAIGHGDYFVTVALNVLTVYCLIAWRFPRPRRFRQ
jgi:hypothetical protein